MEGTHCQLGTWLTNGLSGDDTDGLTDVHLLVGGKRYSVTCGTDTGLSLTGQDRADHDGLNSGFLEPANGGVIDVLASLDQHVLADLYICKVGTANNRQLDLLVI